MKNSRLLLLIPTLLLTGCGDMEHIGNKVNQTKADSIYEDIQFNYDKEECFVADFTREAVTGKGDDKLTEKLRYKSKSDGKNLYINMRKTASSEGVRDNHHIEYYIFQDKTYGTVIYVRDEDLITEKVDKMAVPYGGGYYSNTTYSTNLQYDAYLRYALNTSLIKDQIRSYLDYEPVDAETEETKSQFYSTGKGNLTLKLTYNLKKTALASASDYETVKKGEATLTVDNYRSSKFEYETTSTFGNKETWNLTYTYPKAVKIEPPEGWETHLLTSSYQYGVSSYN